MATTRRQFIGASAGLGLAATGLAKPAIAASGPIRIGWMPALTGTSSSTGIALNRGTMLAVSEINAAGGINGRMLELVTRDTQSDPTKAVNASSELTHNEKVDIVWGPGNSGEALAAMTVIARAQVPQLDPCFVDTVIDPVKYPLAFRNAPSNEQVGNAAATYMTSVLKAKNVALIGDTTGYGTSAIGGIRAHPESKRRPHRLYWRHRRKLARLDRRSFETARCRRRCNLALERQCRVPVAAVERAGADGMGCAGGGAADPRIGPNQGVAGKAGILAEGVPGRFPQCQLRCEWQTAAAVAGLCRSAKGREDRHDGYAALVDHVRLRRALHRGSSVQGRRGIAEGKSPHTGTRSRRSRACSASIPIPRTTITASRLTT